MVPFTDTATGARTAFTSACDQPPTGSLRNRRYVRLSVLAESTSPSVPVMYIRPIRDGLRVMPKVSVVFCLVSVSPEMKWLGYAEPLTLMDETYGVDGELPGASMAVSVRPWITALVTAGLLRIHCVPGDWIG